MSKCTWSVFHTTPAVGFVVSTTTPFASNSADGDDSSLTARICTQYCSPLLRGSPRAAKVVRRGGSTSVQSRTSRESTSPLEQTRTAYWYLAIAPTSSSNGIQLNDSSDAELTKAASRATPGARSDTTAPRGIDGGVASYTIPSEAASTNSPFEATALTIT